MSSLVEDNNASLAFKSIPVIDLASISSDIDARNALVDEIRNACINVGFFYVKNHGITEDTIHGVYEGAKEFFSLPLGSKMIIENRNTPTFRGYSPLLSGNNNPENAGDLQEGFELGWEALEGQEADKERIPHTGVMADTNQWPSESELPRFREQVLQYYHSAIRLGRTLFPLFALALHLPETFFDDKTLNSAAVMKLLHYPPQTGPSDERVIGIGSHTDWECFTILWQEPGIQALQALNAKNEWVSAPPILGTLVINLGDQFARWTNDVFKSTVHRAINRSGVHRYSIPLFFGTDYDVKLEPISSCVSPDRPSKYEIITAGDYVKSRLEATWNH